MNPKNTAYLIKHFPFFQKDFKFECEDGWFNLIQDLSEKLKLLNLPDGCVTQVKQKMGGLRFYLDLSDVHTETRVMANYLIGQEEKLSFEICELCGEVVGACTKHVSK